MFDFIEQIKSNDKLRNFISENKSMLVKTAVSLMILAVAFMFFTFRGPEEKNGTGTVIKKKRALRE